MKKTFQNLLLIIQEDIIGTGNRFIAMTWLAALTALIGLGFYLSSESMSFLGVADSRELQVNFEYPVEIKKVHVIPGQSVRKGDLLVELDQSELTGKIRLIRSQLARFQAEMGVRRTLNTLVSNSSDLGLSDPLAVDIEDMTNELQYLENQRKNLYVFADVDGIVGGVSFKKGEKVPSFTALVTLSPKHPSYVDGFLHESLPTRVEVGRVVTVSAVSSRAGSVEGKVVSVGARIVLMPLRLSIYPNQQVWGREVVVEIPPNNAFLLGEKVQIKPKLEFARLTRDIWPIDKALAKEGKSPAPASTAGDDHTPEPLRISEDMKKRFHIEPSGAIYLPDMKKYLVVSDDTDKQKSASLFLVDTDGSVNDEILVIPGVGEITDMESISQSGDMVYVLTSQGLKKSGKEQPARNMFVRFKRSGLNITDVEAVEFKPILLKAMNASKDAKLKAAFAGVKPGDIEIEGHFVDGKDLYLAFKYPLNHDSHSLILLVRDFASVFTKKQIAASQLGVSQWVDFSQAQGAPHQLSDLIKVNGTLFATTVCKSSTCGAVWKIQKAERNSDRIVAEQLRFYADLRPEGLAYNTHDSEMFVTFDQQKEVGQYNRIPMSAPVLGNQQVLAPKRSGD